MELSILSQLYLLCTIYIYIAVWWETNTSFSSFSSKQKKKKKIQDVQVFGPNQAQNKCQPFEDDKLR